MFLHPGYKRLSKPNNHDMWFTGSSLELAWQRLKVQIFFNLLMLSSSRFFVSSLVIAVMSQFFWPKNERKNRGRLTVVSFGKSRILRPPEIVANIRELTAIAKHDDHAMTWFDHGDSYSPWYDHGKIMAWSS